jgi:HEAT repeat protein
MAEKSFDELLADLKSDDVDTRCMALHHLGTLDDIRVPEILIAALNDNEAHVRSSAVFAIAHRHCKYEEYPTPPFKLIPESPFYIKPLINYLDHEDDSQNIQVAIHLLADLGGEAILPIIIAFLDSPDPFIRLEALRAYEFLKDDIAALPYLLKALKDPDPWVRFHAVHRIGSFKDEAAIAALISVLADNGRLYSRPGRHESVVETSIGEVAERYLIERGSQPIDLLIQTFDNPNANLLLRARVGVVLFKLGDNRAADHILATLDEMRSHDKAFWRESVDVLVEIGEKLAIETLLTQVESENPWVWAIAKTVIMRIHIANGTSPSESEMSAYLQNRDYYFVEAARKQLAQLGKTKTPHR